MSLLTFMPIQTSQMEVKVGANGSNYSYYTFAALVWKVLRGISQEGCWEEQKIDFSSKGSILYVKMYEYA
jgi:hypothetical protein